MALANGTRCGPYEIVAPLGAGGMGEVYRARDPRLGRDVAIKVLPPALRADPQGLARFQREAQTLAALNHPNIAAIYGLEEADGAPCLVLELVEGETLAARLTRGPLTVPETIAICVQVALAVEAAHEGGIVHRDLKPGNVMLSAGGSVKVLDFGLAKSDAAVSGGEGADASTILADPGATTPGLILGTAPYMSPEQTRGQAVDRRSDVWAFGCILYECLTGSAAFSGATVSDRIANILARDPDWSKLPAATPAPVRDALMRCLRKDPSERPPDIRDVRLGLEGTQTTARGRGRWIGVLAVAPVLVAAAVAMLLLRPASKPADSTGDLETIAVLPFVDLSPQKDQEYFSDGLSEELLDVLAQQPNLRVTSRTSSFSFKGQNLDIRTIAQRLSVKHVLEGSVRKSGENLRITAQLIRADSDTHLWSRTYDGTLEDIFALQDSIARSVTEALKVILLGGPPAPRRKVDPAAYNAYLLGRHFDALERNSKKAVEYYRQAIAEDSSFAPAWMELSRSHCSQANEGDLPTAEGYELARAEVTKALQLDPGYANAYAQLGFIKRRYDWDWQGADAAYQRALQLDPGDASVLRGAAGLARTLGRFDEAVTLMRRAVEREPVSANGYLNLGLYAWSAGRLEEAQAANRKCLELSPGYGGVHQTMGAIYLQQGQPDSALAAFERESDRDWQLIGFAMYYHAQHDEERSNAALTELIRDYQYEDAFQIAEVYAFRGEADEAFEWLDRAYAQRDGGLPSIKGSPMLKMLASDPRFVALLEKLRLPV